MRKLLEWYGKIAEPSTNYFKIIKKGYKDFGININPLKKALDESKQYKQLK